jgi:hypothetical protein
MAALTEGIDYYMEGGFMVFTEAYHRSRGFCCDSGCRHCPWKELRSDKAAESNQPSPISETRTDGSK